MAGKRLLRILAQLSAGGDPDPGTDRLCDVCAGATGMSGAGIMLMSGDLPRGSLCSTDKVSALIEDLQYELGEGPCVDAYREDRPVLEPDLANPTKPRWIAFAGPAVAAGVGAVFGFPLQVGAVRLGALNLYRDRSGPLTDDQHADALVVAHVAAQSVLAMQADAPAGQVAAGLESGADFKIVVHQATGMVAAQLRVSVSVALVRLRAYAFGSGRPLVEVAQDVVSRKLRFDPFDDAQDDRP